jgi:hypothetical protein
MKTEIRRKSTSEQNISKRHVTFDVYLNGQYAETFNDIIDAEDFIEAKIIDIHEFQRLV